MDAAARTWVRKLGLEPHPEGGWFRETYRSAGSVHTRRGRRSALTSIYFLLAQGQRSVFHRVTSDEVWHYCAGAPLDLWRVPGDFLSRERIRLGPPGRGKVPVAVIGAGEWQAAETRGSFTLVGCTVGPGFDFADFVLLRDAPREAARMRKTHPDLAARLI